MYSELLLGAHVPCDLSLAPALDGMTKRSAVAPGDEPVTPARFQSDRLPRTWPGGASRPRFGGRVWAEDYDDDRYG
jgi:hypothetical protein